MQAYLFSASDISPDLFSHSIEKFYESCDSIFEVVLSESSFRDLLSLLGLSNSVESELTSNQDFAYIFDLSKLKFPELTPEEFDAFYEVWLKKTGRESTMDEYGQLIFIQSYAAIWNLKEYRFVLVEKSS